MRALGTLSAAAFLASCGSEGETPSAPEQVSSTSVEYEQLTEADRQRFPLSGDVACAFTKRRLGAAKMSVAGFADGSAPPQALVKIAGTPYRLDHDEAGRESLEQGGIFLAGNIIARVRTTGPVIEENIPIADESPQYPALLSISRNGEREDIEGYWECMPRDVAGAEPSAQS